MLLRGEVSRGRRLLGVALSALVGGAAALLVVLGNPGNMGLCGACFLRDLAGALGLSEKAPACFRPEVPGVMLGALGLALLGGRYTARSGSHAAARFVLGALMGIAALVFLGCPFRLLQRLGGGDLNAWLALPGFLAGVGAGMVLERGGYTVGKTSPAPAALGLLGPLAAVALVVLFLMGGVLKGPGPGGAPPPPHAPWIWALGVAVLAGAALSATGFCAISAARQVFKGPRAMLGAAGALMAGYALVLLAAGRLEPGLFGQPVAHGDWLWNSLALALLGLTGALAGGCPVRQVVMAGEGNGDAFVTAAGILSGGALAHNLGLVSAAQGSASPGGATPGGKGAVVIGLAAAVLYGLAVAWSARRAAARARRPALEPFAAAAAVE